MGHKKNDARPPRPALSIVACLVLLVAGAGARGDESATPGSVPREALLAYLADHSTFTLIDARSPDEYAAAHIEGSINIPYDALAAHAAELPAAHTAPIVIYCRTGSRAGNLRDQLRDAGYTDVRVLEGSRIHWFDDMAVFNCAADSPTSSPADDLAKSADWEGDD